MAGLAIDIRFPVTETKELQDRPLARKSHCDTLCTALLIRCSKGTKHRSPRLAGLIVGADRLEGNGRNRRVLDIEVELARCCLLKQLATAMPKQLVETDLDFERGVAVLLVSV